MEGGKIFTHNSDLYHILLSLRAHGQTRNLPKNNLVAKKFGINSKQIIFTKFFNDTKEHLAKIKVADLFHDIFPYNSQASASDTIQSGLPVLTCMGKSFSS